MNSIDDDKVIKTWQHFLGIKWLATDKAWTQDSIIKGKTYKNDQIYYGFVTGPTPEWGYFSEAELKLNFPKVCELSKELIKQV